MGLRPSAGLRTERVDIEPYLFAADPRRASEILAWATGRADSPATLGSASGTVERSRVTTGLRSKPLGQAATIRMKLARTTMDGRQLMFTIDPDGHETRALHSLVDFRDKDVIEIGAGDGRMTWRYADAARSVIALDPLEGDINLAMRSSPEHLRERVRFLPVDATT